MRSDNKRGIKVLLLENGTLIDEIKQIHTNPILQIIVMNDNRNIITCAKDKKIKVYDWF